MTTQKSLVHMLDQYNSEIGYGYLFVDEDNFTAAGTCVLRILRLNAH